MRLAIHSTELGAFDFDPRTGRAVWSEFAKRHFGLPPHAEVDFPTFLRGIHPGDRDRVEALVTEALRADGAGQFAAEYRTVGLEDGVERWISSSGRAFFDAHGEPERFIGVTLDITGRKRSEEVLHRALAEAEAGRRLLDATLEYVPLGIVIADGPEFKIRKVSQFWLRLMGKTADEISALAPGDHPAEFHMYRPGEREPAPIKDLPLSRATVLGELVRDEEWLLAGKDGARVPILCTAAPILDPSGKIAGGVTCWYDMTQRKITEQALEESERHFRELADSMPQLVWMSAADGTLAYHNRQWEIQLGIAEGEPLGQGWTGLLHPEDREGCVGKWRRSLETGSPCELECRLRAAGGAWRWFLGRAVPVRDSAGEVARWFGTWTDIDEGKRGEERLREAQKLESIGLLAGGIAHDFNNLLTGILGNASLLTEQPDPAAADRAVRIVSAAERAADLTRQLLAYAGKGQFYVENIDFSASVRGMEELIRVSVPRNASIRIDAAGRLPRVKMDPSQLQQVVLNLAINAGEAIGEGNQGAIGIALGLSDIERPFTAAVGEDAPPGLYVWIEVADTGPGMDAATVARIFDPFYTTKFTGRGLGLAAVAGIVRSLKGAITVNSAPGRGSRLRVYFPALEPVKARKAVAPRHGSILVIEDEGYVRDFLTATITGCGYRAVTVRNAGEALSMCESGGERPKAIILDVITPTPACADDLRRINSCCPQVKVLLTSGYAEADVRHLCGEWNGAAFIQKPYSAQELAARLDSLLG